MALLPASVLFCCDHNAVRSPMAEGLMKKLHGARIFVQSAGVKHDMEVDPFAVAVCAGYALDALCELSLLSAALPGGPKVSATDLTLTLSLP